MSTPYLALYYFDGCPYCELVLSAIARLGLDVELRNVHSSKLRLQELVAATGRRTVPVLRIEGSGGQVGWLRESADIVRWLRGWAEATELSCMSSRCSSSTAVST